MNIRLFLAFTLTRAAAYGMAVGMPLVVVVPLIRAAGLLMPSAHRHKPHGATP